MNIRIYTTILLRRITLSVFLIVSGLGLYIFSHEVAASALQTDSLTHMNVSQFHRCQGQWRYRCGKPDTTTEDFSQGEITLDNLTAKLNDEAKYRRCGRSWQYHCAGEKDTLESKSSIARHEYLINDQQTFDEQNGISAQEDYMDKAPQYRRCGRFWQFRCASLR